MAQGRRTSVTVELTPEDRQTLEAWQRSTTIMAGPARRGRIILMLADGASVTDVARAVGMRRRFIYKWAQRFTDQGVPGLNDKPGRGRRGEPALTEPRVLAS
ncbi:MAG TPA: helix-turn-helix domain-containing protein [Dehalococcoidia bacterium]|nr:helix-turn-helix domain-containing protein [Dehalococcoidia bacterium]